MAKREIVKPKRLPKDFDHTKPGVEITDPDRVERESEGILADREFPKHLHKFVEHGQPHAYVEVVDAKEEAAKRREGWMSPQEAAAVGAAKKEPAAGAAAKAPRAKKPAAKKAAKQ